MNIPNHVAIIPDGNRRWAKKQGLSFFQGHKQAAEKTLPELIESSGKLGIKYFTFWALSTENLEKRTKNEVEKLLSLMRFFLKKKLNEFKKKGVKLMTIGDLKKLPLDIQDLITKGKKETQKNKKIHVIFAINYGGRNEIVRAIQKIRNPFTVNPFRMNPKSVHGESVQDESEIRNLNEEKLSKLLDTIGIPDPDLIIRTGGEKRLSGFLPWQSVYSELYFSDLYFPDFDAKELKKAVKDYSLRQRRFGK